MFLDRLFGNKGEGEEKILKCLGADMHSHLIPGVDDGAKDYETAFSCIAEMKRYGINKNLKQKTIQQKGQLEKKMADIGL